MSRSEGPGHRARAFQPRFEAAAKYAAEAKLRVGRRLPIQAQIRLPGQGRYPHVSDAIRSPLTLGGSAARPGSGDHGPAARHSGSGAAAGSRSGCYVFNMSVIPGFRTEDHNHVDLRRVRT